MTKKTVNSDIYNLSQLVDDVKSNFIPDETEDTLAIGTYGYIGAVESHRLQTQVQMTGELANEAFASRSRLERNVITHAIMANIDDINAIPAKMTAFIAIREVDVKNHLDNDNSFIVDRECPIYLGDYEFHLEYDIILRKITDKESPTKTYTAMYDMSRPNPSSNISNPYLAPPTVVNVSGFNYIYLTVILSQVEHNREYKKLVTSNVIDNKTISFNFTNQLAYFEVHCIESSEEYYLTPCFEGSAIPDGVSNYCWYQYIDTDLIRVRFDRNSYMPGLNAEIEILFKTCQGDDGNFSFKSDVFESLDSSKYGYSGITVLVSPVSDSANGKDRKSKKELQGLIPKEILARGSLTTITDLNNYFGMLDSENGRIVIQKKIDNQIERVYYAYFVAKDSNMNVIPTNTIDLKVSLDELLDSTIAESQAPRYVLKSGTCIKYNSDGSGSGYVNHSPIEDHGESMIINAYPRGKEITVQYKAKVQNDSYGKYSASATVNGASTQVLLFPSEEGEREEIPESNAPITTVEDYMQMSIGSKYLFTESYYVENDNSTITISDSNLPELEFVDGWYYIDENENDVIHFSSLPVTISELEQGSRVTFGIVDKLLIPTSNTLRNDISIQEEGISFITSKIFITYVPTITQDIYPSEDELYKEITYTVKYISSSKSLSPKVILKLSRGLYYTVFTALVTAERSTYPQEPVDVDISSNLGFIYTNPYAISINGYHLYSAFYMFSMEENPYVHFDYINKRSDVQFICTNVYWNRPFLGDDKDIYHIRTTISQSVLDDLGVIPKEEVPRVKAIAVFYRDGSPYRYKSLDLVDYVDGQKSFTFAQDFYAIDTLDNDNNIRVEGMQVPGQLEYSVNLNYNDKTYTLLPNQKIMMTELMDFFGITKGESLICYSSNSRGVQLIPNNKEDILANTDYTVWAMNPFAEDIELTVKVDDTYYTINAVSTTPYMTEYGYFNPSTEVKIYALCNLPGIDGIYDRHDLDSICPGLTDWSVTNIYDVVNGVTFYYNYSEIMGSRVIPYGTSHTDESGNETMELEGYYIMNVPMIGYDYAQDEILVQEAINALNNRKAYIDNSLEVLENSFGIDFKLFNTFGPSKTYYIIKDSDESGTFETSDYKEYIDRINLTLNFRIKLIASNDSYTVDNIKREIKEYVEDLEDLADLHIPNLITQITTNYQENIVYFEFLGFNNYGPEIQHIYKDADAEIGIHIAPEFLNINNIIDEDRNIIPDINIHISEI